MRPSTTEAITPNFIHLFDNTTKSRLLAERAFMRIPDFAKYLSRALLINNEYVTEDGISNLVEKLSGINDMMDKVLE